MPKVIKKKTPKKKAVQDDDVKSAAFQALDVIKKKQKGIIIGVSVIAAIAILFIVISLYSTSRYKKASTIQVDANNYYYGMSDAEASEEQRLKKAIDLYKQSLAIRETPLALFYLGNSYFKLGDFDNAKKEYERFIHDFSGNELILPLVYQKMISAHFRTNENDKAIEAINTLSSLNNGIFRDTALILEARHYDRIGDDDKALAKYREIVDTFQTSPWSAEAASKIAAATEETGGEESQASGSATEEKTESMAEKKPAEPVTEKPSVEKPSTEKDE
ncbi:MAG: tetratricopeptide repeat protein [Nitrospiraceae bacterium]|nr:MAG: tetratricopeptide repeat protein [Nitrospiraceae bacterium]